MSELIRHGRAVAGVFDLLGFLENHMTDALGFTLSRSPVLVQLLVSDLGYEDEFADDDVVISVQTHRPDQGVTDLEIRIRADFLAILEAKSDATLPSQEQLSLYEGVLAEHSASRKVLVALTNATQHAASTSLASLSVPSANLTHRSWRQVRELAIRARAKESNRAKALLDDFIVYLGGIVGMETRFDNRVYVVSLGAGNWEGWSLSWVDIVEKRGFYFYPVGKNWPDPPNYLGFRYRGRLQRIHHVEGYEIIHNFHDVFPEAPDEACEPHYNFKLGPAIIPDHEVKAGPRVVRAGRVWCAIDTLLTAPTISEALDETRRRMLVPRVLGQTTESVDRKSVQRTKRQWDEASFRAALEGKDYGKAATKVVDRFLEWAKEHDYIIWYGLGMRDGSLQIGTYVGDVPYVAFVLYTSGYLETQFQYLTRRPPFDDLAMRREYADQLLAIDGVAFKTDEDTLTNRRPSILLKVFSDDARVDQLVGVLDWFAGVLKGAKQPEPSSWNPVVPEGFMMGFEIDGPQETEGGGNS